jgi:hypothetical protein
MSRQQWENLTTIAVVVIAVYDRVDVDPARVWRAEWQICSRVAAWMGRRALCAEARYREAIAP